MVKNNDVHSLESKTTKLKTSEKFTPRAIKSATHVIPLSTLLVLPSSSSFNPPMMHALMHALLVSPLAL